MGITNMEISTTFLIIIIRTNHGQTEIVMQYGGLRSSVTCVTTYCSNDSFASPINRCIKACGMLFHSCTSASSSSCSVSGGVWRWRTRLPSSFHKCSIGDRSGDNDGQERTRMWFRYCRKGRTIGSRISSLYFTTFNVPWTILSWVRPSW